MEEVLTEEILLNKVTDEEIFRYYIGNHFEPNSTISSPLREKDVYPSFSVFKPYNIKNNGRLLFKDFALNLTGDVFFFVALLKGVSREQALHEIDFDMKLHLNGSKYGLQSENFIRIPDKEDITISIFGKDFTNSGLEYWESHGISLSTLKKYNVQQIEAFKVNEATYFAKNLDWFAWSIVDRFKILRLGVDKHKKWRNNFKPTFVEGYVQLEKDESFLPKKGKKFIITKALKEVMFIYEQFRIPSITASSESSMIPEKMMSVIMERFEEVYLLVDNDATGLKLDRKYQDRYPAIKVIKSPKYKNITDFFLEEPCLETLDSIKGLWR